MFAQITPLNLGDYVIFFFVVLVCAVLATFLKKKETEDWERFGLIFVLMVFISLVSFWMGVGAGNNNVSTGVEPLVDLPGGRAYTLLNAHPDGKRNVLLIMGNKARKDGTHRFYAWPWPMKEPIPPTSFTMIDGEVHGLSQPQPAPQPPPGPSLKPSPAPVPQPSASLGAANS